jgi:hypothetical protein
MKSLQPQAAGFFHGFFSSPPSDARLRLIHP